MNKDEIRLKLVHAMDIDPERIYMTLVGKHGPVPAEIEVLNTEDGLWYAVAIVALEPQKRIVTQ